MSRLTAAITCEAHIDDIDRFIALFDGSLPLLRCVPDGVCDPKWLIGR
jgi:hypothetical protein